MCQELLTDPLTDPFSQTVAHGIFIQGRNVVDIGTIGLNTTASGLNLWGQVVGSSQIIDQDQDDASSDAVLYSGGKLTNLGVAAFFASAGTGAGSGARAINDFGVIVGQSNALNGLAGQIGTVEINGSIYDFNEVTTGIPIGSPREFLDFAFAINDAGQVLVEGRNGGPTFSYLLTRVK